MTHEFDEGYAREPFASIVRDYPGAEAYPPDDFRLEWGPIFHRGRLDGSAKVLVIGQDPGQHENVARRILVGEAGQRVQGFLRKLGISTSYVMINSFLYSVYGYGGDRHHEDEAIVGYRNRWLDALLLGTQVRAVVAFGRFADEAFEMWKDAHAGEDLDIAYQHVTHPTYPESASAHGQVSYAEAMEQMLVGWNAAIAALTPAIASPDVPQDPTSYGAALVETDRAPIPELDLPAGVPAWMRGLDAWALRSGTSTDEKRSTIVVTVPEADRLWTPLDGE